ncbi:MAG: hypothetical protein AAF447_12455 [Myxococcota bacterium]
MGAHRRVNFAFFLVVLGVAGPGCGDDGAPDTDAGPQDGGVRDDAGLDVPDGLVEAPRIPWLDEGAPPVAIPWLDDGVPPIEWPCAEGWRERSIEGARACEPFAADAPSRCSAGEVHLPGTPGCAPVGRACGEGRFASTADVPSGTPILHVDAATEAGGDGSSARPFRALGDALDRAAPGALLALAAGSYAVDREWPDSLSLRGVCAARTTLVAAGDVPAILSLGPGSAARAIEDVTLTASDLPALRVTGAGPRVELRGLEVRSTGTYPAAMRVGGGADVVVDGLGARHLGSGPADTFGLSIDGGASVEGQRVSFDGFVGVGLAVTGTGSSASLTEAVIRNTAERTPPAALGSGVQAAAGARLVLERTLLLDNVETGVTVLGDGTTATLTELVVRGTQPTEGFYSAGLGVLLGAQAVAERVLADGNVDVAVGVDSGGASLSLRDGVITGTRARPESRTAGLSALRPSALEIERVAVVGNATNGISASEGGNIMMSDALVGVAAAGGLSGGGITLNGGTHRLDRLVIRETLVAGVSVMSGTLVAHDMVVRESNARDGAFGIGMFLSDAESTLERLVVDGARYQGIGATDGRLTLRDVLVRDLRGAEPGPPLPEGSWGRGIVLDGTESLVERALIEDVGEAGLLVRSGFMGDGRAEVSDIVIRNVTGERSSGLRGRAVSVQQRTELILARARIEEVREAGIAVTQEASFRGESVLVVGVTEPPCVARGDCPEPPPPGVGLGAYDEGSLELTGFALREATCGVQLAGNPSFDLEDGSIAAAAVGVCLQSPGYAVERLRGDVVYDVEVAVETTSFPVPEPILDNL